MNLLQLRYFVAVAEELNFRRASQRLNVSQPPLSFHVKSLEEEIGARLFNRSTRQVELTDAGQILLGRAREILALVSRTTDEMHDIASGGVGTLRVAFTISTSFHSFFHRTVQEYRRRYPKVHLVLSSLSSGPQINALINGGIDVGLLRWPGEAVEGLVSAKLHSSSLMLAVHISHPLAAATGDVALTEVRDAPFITYPSTMSMEIGIYNQIQHLCENAGFSPRIVHEVLEPSLIIGLVAAGSGVAIVPTSLQCLEIPGVAYKSIADPAAETSLNMVRRADDLNPRIQSFWDVAMETVSLDDR